jgi:Papain fold toxin 2
MSVEDIYQEIGEITQNFEIYQCDDCARAIMGWLKDNGISGKILKLKTVFRQDDYILSQRLEKQGITESITDNGTHYGVEVFGRVFDNLSTEGMVREDWLEDFDCPNHLFTVTEMDSL